MNLIDRTFDYIKERRDKILKGGINSIPSPFVRFSDEFIGIEQRKYYIVTANTKVGKTQLASFLFLFTPLLYAYEHPEQLRIKIFYFPLEETPEDVTLRFMSFLLNKYTGIRLSPSELSSSSNKALDENVIEALNSDTIKDILNFYNEHVEFSATRNPTGINKEVEKYMRDNGTIHWKKTKIKDDFGGIREVEAFDYYTPNDPNEYVLLFVDHVSLLQPENGLKDKAVIDKLSEYCVILRNRYGVSPVLIQQQAADRESLDAFKENKLRPTSQGLADSKYTARDCNCLLGIFSPFRHELPEYKKYDITKLQRNCIFLEVILNRGGNSGGLVGLFFDGVTCEWAELPRPDDMVGMNKVYAYIKRLRDTSNSKMFFMKIINYVKSLYN
jgi:hypothetical protein